MYCSVLSRYRLVHGSSFALLGSLFMCGKKAARKAFWDIGMYQLMLDPLGSLPNLFSSDITDQELEQFLLDIIQRQSPGVQRLVARLRTPDGRQVCLYCTLPKVHLKGSSIKKNNCFSSRKAQHLMIETTY